MKTDTEMTWAELKQFLANMAVEAEKQRAEAEKRHTKTEEGFRRMAEAHAEFERRNKELQEIADKRHAETERVVQNVSQQLGSIGNNQGAFAEEIFYNTLEEKKEFAGVKFDSIDKNVRGMAIGGIKDEFDIMMMNGTTIALIEVKTKIHKNDIVPMAEKKTSNFRKCFTDYKDYKIVFAIASLVFGDKEIAEAKENGIGIIKLKGKTFEIDTENIKFY